MEVVMISTIDRCTTRGIPFETFSTSLSAIQAQPQPSNSLLDTIKKVASQIKNYFYHIYTDVRVFIRSWKNVQGPFPRGGLRMEVERLIRSLNQADASLGVYRRLSFQVREQFYCVDQTLITSFHREQNPVAKQELKEEIVRECKQLISFHQLLALFWPPTITEYQSRPHEAEQSWEYPLNSSNPSSIELDIFGTVPYRADAIPSDVETKSREIERLSLVCKKEIPEKYKDQISDIPFLIPVFDASHPSVQKDLHNRNYRHHMDKESLEALYASKRTAPTLCPECRHPMKRKNLRIDTELQDEILMWLQGNVERH
jgi:hypothetical protein